MRRDCGEVRNSMYAVTLIEMGGFGGGVLWEAEESRAEQ